MFPAVNKPVPASVKLMKDLDNVGLLAKQWAMSFNPDSPNNSKTYFFFSRKIKNTSSGTSIS